MVNVNHRFQLLSLFGRNKVLFRHYIVLRVDNIFPSTSRLKPSDLQQYGCPHCIHLTQKIKQSSIHCYCINWHTPFAMARVNSIDMRLSVHKRNDFN